MTTLDIFEPDSRVLKQNVLKYKFLDKLIISKFDVFDAKNNQNLDNFWYFWARFKGLEAKYSLIWVFKSVF